MKMLLFGALADKAGFQEKELQGLRSTSELDIYLKESMPEVHAMTYSVAVNGVITNSDTPLEGSEEIALLPPFSGG